MSDEDFEVEFEVDQEQDPWARTPYWLLTAVGDAALRTYIALARYASMRDGARPTINRLAEDTGRSRSTIKRAIEELQTAGAIKVRQRFDPKHPKRRIASQYMLRISEPTRKGGVTSEPTPGVMDDPTPGSTSEPTLGSPVTHVVRTKSVRTKTDTRATPKRRRGPSRTGGPPSASAAFSSSGYQPWQ